MKLREIAVPEGSFLHRYSLNRSAYTDCFEVGVTGCLDLETFITAFYTTWLFRLERLVLSLVLRRRITDQHVAALADGDTDQFAVWRVEAREDGQILLKESSGATRSYFAIEAQTSGTTRLIFGSAVVPRSGTEISRTIRFTVPLHKLYSRALLRLTERRLRRG